MTDRDDNIQSSHEEARRLLEEATELVQWTDPNGCVHVGPRGEILEIIRTASWR